MRGKVVIAGVGQTTFGRIPNRDRISLIVQAVRAALADAGLAKDRVDGILVKMANSDPQVLFGQKVAESLGVRPKFGCSLDQGGAANIALITYAALAIDAGMMDVCVVCFGDTPRSGSRAVYHRPRGDDAVHGWFSTAAGYAMIHQAYRDRYAIADEAFGRVAVTCRDHGARNPAAQLRKPLSMDDYLSSPLVVEPLRRDDCCLISDGAVAIVMTSAKLASTLGLERAVPIIGLGQAQESYDVQFRRDLTSTAARSSAEMAFRMAGLRPSDISVAQLYDCFTVTVLMTMEDYGFCNPGEADAFMADQGVGWGDLFPLNTSGGLLSETGTPGLQLVIEGVRQMRGEANLQVRCPHNCIVSNQGGTMHTHGTLILGSPA